MRDPLERFGPVWGASGATNFFDQGWPFHEKLKRWCPGFNLDRMTFVAKTMTTDPREGNMPSEPLYQMPLEKRPKCIKINWRRAAALNAVGLTNRGAKTLFAIGKWQEMKYPLFLSFAPQGANAEERYQDAVKFGEIALREIPRFHALVGLQLNITCPNTGDDVTGSNADALVEEAMAMLTELAVVGIPIVVKVNALMPPEAAMKIGGHAACAGITASNALPWASLPGLGIDRVRLFGSDESPLAEFGGGGLSGAPLFPIVERWVKSVREAGFRKHLNAGGGIMKASHPELLKYAGADSVSIGSMLFLRPWRTESTIDMARRAFLWGAHT